MAGGESGSRRRLIGLLVLGGLAVIVIVGAAIWFLFLDAPDEVSIDDATAQLAEGSGAGGSDGDAPVGIEGSWAVDTSIGEFGFEDTTGSFVGFRVGEDFSDIGFVTAVGRTPAVTGTLDIADETVTTVSIETEIGEFVTDDSRRDTSVLGTLDVFNHPTATFVLTEPITLPADVADAPAGEAAFSAEAIGELTIKGVTNPATFAIDAELVDGVIAVVGSTEITFADYEVVPPSVEPPQAPIVIIVDDNGIVEFQLFFTRTG